MSDKKSKGVVIRISRANHNRIKNLLEFDSEKNRRLTINEMLEKLLDITERVGEGHMLYVVGTKAYMDLAEARGEAIMDAVKEKQIPTFPKVAVIIGEDQGV